MRMVNVDRSGDNLSTITYYIFRFKLFLEPKALRDESTVDPRLPRLPVSADIPCSSGNRLSPLLTLIARETSRGHDY